MKTKRFLMGDTSLSCASEDYTSSSSKEKIITFTPSDNLTDNRTAKAIRSVQFHEHKLSLIKHRYSYYCDTCGKECMTAWYCKGCKVDVCLDCIDRTDIVLNQFNYLKSLTNNELQKICKDCKIPHSGNKAVQ